MGDKSVYLIGSLRNPQVPVVGNALRAAGYDAFDQWFGGGRDADEEFLRYARVRGWSYAEALASEAVENTFEFDYRHLVRCRAAVLVAPAGKSAHMELGWVIGSGKPGFVLFPAEPERFDVMYRFCLKNGGTVCFSLDELLTKLKAVL